MRWLLMTLVFRFSDTWSEDGMEIINVTGENGHVRNRLRAALALIARVDPLRYRRLRRDMRRIALLRRGGPEYASEVGACLLPSAYLKAGTTEAVATTIVHEATHARLCRAGIGYGPAMRPRVEAACIRQQIAFAERLGDAYILEHLRTRLRDHLPGVPATTS